MKKLISAILILLSTNHLSAQAPNIIWQKTFGGTDEDRATSITQTVDGGYIVAGNTKSNDGNVTGHHAASDYWIVKLNDTGGIQWQKSIGGDSDDVANSIKQAIDGGYVVAGYTNSNNGDVTGNIGGTDYWIVKLDDTGAIAWQKCYGGTANDYAFDIQLTKDSGYIIGGHASSNDVNVSGNHSTADDYWIVKIDDTGAIQWQKCYGGIAEEHACYLQQTSDGGYIVVGTASYGNGDVTGYHDNIDYWVVKLDDTGRLEWQKCLGGFLPDFGYSVAQTFDSGYIVAGYTTSQNDDVTGNHGSADAWIAKLDAGGTLQWQKCLGGSLGDGAVSVSQTTDSNYIVAGFAESDDGDVSGCHGAYDYWIIKLNDTGAIIWRKCLGGTGSDEAQSIQQISPTAYIVAGVSNSYDGDITNSIGGDDYWIVKLDTSTIQLIANVTNSKSPISILPNPSDGHLTITLPGNTTKTELTVTNMLGELMLRKMITGQKVELTIAQVPGVYFVRVNADNVIYTGKLVIQ